MAARTIGEWLRRFRKSLNPRSQILDGRKPLRASDIVLAMAAVMLLALLSARLLTQLFGQGRIGAPSSITTRWSHA